MGLTSVLWPLNTEHGLLQAMDRFDLETAYILAQASRAAYPDSVQTAQAQLGLDQIIPFEEGVVAGFCWPLWGEYCGRVSRHPVL